MYRGPVHATLAGNEYYDHLEGTAMTPSKSRERAAMPNASALRGSRSREALENAEADSNHALGLGRPPGELPRELSSFLGRSLEISEAKRLLGDTRLLTLTGPGGCGKTRLAMAVGFEVVWSFEDGVWWVGLASL
jgi:predicted ribonuclease YlaK